MISIYLMDYRSRLGENPSDEGGGFDGGLGIAGSDREGMRGTRTYTKVLISVTAIDRPKSVYMYASTGAL
jgi:hypothetical protein